MNTIKMTEEFLKNLGMNLAINAVGPTACLKAAHRAARTVAILGGQSSVHADLYALEQQAVKELTVNGEFRGTASDWMPAFALDGTQTGYVYVAK